MQVVCRQLGYASGEAVTSKIVQNQPILLHSVECTGQEQALLDCKYKLGGTYCSTAAIVRCSNESSGVEIRECHSGMFSIVSKFNKCLSPFVGKQSPEPLDKFN